MTQQEKSMAEQEEAAIAEVDEAVAILKGMFTGHHQAGFKMGQMDANISFGKHIASLHPEDGKDNEIMEAVNRAEANPMHVLMGAMVAAAPSMFEHAINSLMEAMAKATVIKMRKEGGK